jgi:hypothetical protein
MMSLAYSLKLSNQQLTLLVKSLESKFEQAILEAIVEIDFLSLRRPPDNFHFDDAFDLSKWERGRAFGTEMELRWRRRGDDFLSLIICESPLLLAPEVGAIIGTLGNARFLDRVELRLYKYAYGASGKTLKPRLTCLARIAIGGTKSECRNSWLIHSMNARKIPRSESRVIVCGMSHDKKIQQGISSIASSGWKQWI